MERHVHVAREMSVACCMRLPSVHEHIVNTIYAVSATLLESPAVTCNWALDTLGQPLTSPPPSPGTHTSPSTALPPANHSFSIHWGGHTCHAFLAPRDLPATSFTLFVTLSCQPSPFEDQPHVISLTGHKDTQHTHRRRDLEPCQSGQKGVRFGWY